MLLRTEINLDGQVLRYAFNPKTDFHTVTLTNGCSSAFKTTIYKLPGEVISAIAPYRDNADVRVLSAWLASQCRLPNYLPPLPDYSKPRAA